MSHVGLIDSAIKLVVGIPRAINSRTVYSRNQLLSLKNCSVAKQWPPNFDKRFARYKNGKNPNLLPVFNNTNTRDNDTLFPAHSNEYFDNRERIPPLEFYDEAIVYARVSDNSQMAERITNFYDHSVTPRNCRNSRSQYSSTFSQEPEWYIDGPSNVEEELDFRDGNITTADEEKENNVNQLKKSITPPISDRPSHFQTLKEIESKLKANKSETNDSVDIGVHCKLTDLVGKSANVSSTDKPLLSEVETHSLQRMFRSTNNNQPRTSVVEQDANTLNFDHIESDIYSDPAVTKVVWKPKASVFENPNGVSKELDRQSQNKTNNRAAFNALATSYQRQVVSHGPLGENALRWFKAMTNAASASACINQHLENQESANYNVTSDLYQPIGERDTPVNNCSTEVEQEGITGNFVKKHAKLGILEETAGTTAHNVPPVTCDSDRINQQANNRLIQPLLNEQVMRAPMNLRFGFGHSILPLKPLTYCTPQTMQMLSRPMLHPVLFQHLIQRQLDMRNAAMRLPFHYLRSQAMLPFTNRNAYSPSFYNLNTRGKYLSSLSCNSEGLSSLSAAPCAEVRDARGAS